MITITRPVSYTESKGFYTYLYSGSILFMCYIFFYVLKVLKFICKTRIRWYDWLQVKVKGELDPEQVEVDKFIQQMVQATGIELKAAVSTSAIIAMHSEDICFTFKVGKPGDGRSTRRLTIYPGPGPDLSADTDNLPPAEEMVPSV